MSKEFRLISHRGNIAGRNIEKENSVNYLYNALNCGFEVETDVWFENGSWWLGHDTPDHPIQETFLVRPDVWCHAKNAHTLQKLLEIEAHCFYHRADEVILTSKNIPWVYPGEELIKGAICVKPEQFPEIINRDVIKNKVEILGFCSDHIGIINSCLKLV